MRAGWESQSGRRGESSDSLEDPETQSQCREKGCCPFAAALLSSSSAQRATGSSPRRTRRNPAALTPQRAFLSVYFWKSHPASPSGATRLSSWSGRALSMEAASRDPRIRQPYESTKGVRSLPRALPRLVARDGGIDPPPNYVHTKYAKRVTGSATSRIPRDGRLPERARRVLLHYGR